MIEENLKKIGNRVVFTKYSRTGEEIKSFTNKLRNDKVVAGIQKGSSKYGLFTQDNALAGH